MGGGGDIGRLLADARPAVIAALVARFRDLDLAEDGFSDAAEALLSCGGNAALPDNVSGWLYVTASRRIIDRLRKEQRHDALSGRLGDSVQGHQEEEEQMIARLDRPIPDHRLALIFTCCHPALAPAARIALTLRTICGVPTARIASAFLTEEPTMYQRITRAKAKIAKAGVPFEIPPRRNWAERTASVLATLEIAYALVYQDAAGAREEADLAPEVLRLSALLVELLPGDPEILGFAALVRLAEARRDARVDDDGVMVPLSEQDANLWNAAMIEQGVRLLDRAADLRRSGPYQLLAAIHLTHIRRLETGKADWATIVALYDMLIAMRPGMVAAINRAIAVGHDGRPQEALDTLDALDRVVAARHRPYHAARGWCLARMGRNAEAVRAYRAALALDPAPAERGYLESRIASLGG